MAHVFNFLFANMHIAWNDFFEELFHFALHAILDKYVKFTFAALTLWKKLNFPAIYLLLLVHFFDYFFCMCPLTVVSRIEYVL